MRTMINSVREHYDILFDLISEWHPAYGPVDCKYEITSAILEYEAKIVRGMIRGATQRPLAMFEKAVKEGDTHIIQRILKETLIGIPCSLELRRELGARYIYLISVINKEGVKENEQ